MTSQVKTIRRSEPTGVVKLTATELNNIRFSSNHTVLTPKRIEAAANQESTPPPPVSDESVSVDLSNYQ